MRDHQGMKNIRHIGLVVSSIDNALRFYRDLLGLKIDSSTDESGNLISELIGHERVKLKTVKLCAVDNGTRLELIELINPKPILNKGYELTNKGFTHIALTVNNLEEIYTKLKEKGIQFNSPPKISSNGSLKLTFCRDFEGNFLELIQEISK